MYGPYGYCLPIPGHDGKNKHHRRLVSLAIQAEKISTKAHDPNETITGNRTSVMDAIKYMGASKKIDGVCSMILPNHTT